MADSETPKHMPESGANVSQEAAPPLVAEHTVNITPPEVTPPTENKESTPSGQTEQLQKQNPDSISTTDEEGKPENSDVKEESKLGNDNKDVNEAVSETNNTDEAKATISDAEKPKEENDEKSAAVDEKQVSEATKPPTPPCPAPRAGPQTVKPVDMYVKRPTSRAAPPPTTAEGRYMAQHLGTALTLALAEIAEHRPWDPIEYLAKWLHNYHRNTSYAKSQEEVFAAIRGEEAKANDEEVEKFKRKEELRRLHEEEMEKKRLEEEERKKREQEELQRKAREANLAQQPTLSTVREDEEEEEDDPSVRDRDGDGRTEMHKLAAQVGVDLRGLIDLGYSIADRDAAGRSVRDVAVEAKQQDTVDAIDKYFRSVLQDGRTDILGQLALEGLDELDDVTPDDLPDVTQKFLARHVGLKEQISSAFKVVEAGDLAELKESLAALPTLAQAKDKDGRSLLHWAVLVNNKDMVDHIVSSLPATLTYRDNLNRTPLHYASGISKDLASMLVSKGASTKAKDALKRPAQYYEANKSEISQIQTSLGINTSDATDSQENKAPSESDPPKTEAAPSEETQEQHITTALATVVQT